MCIRDSYAAMEALGEIMTVEPAGRLYQALVEARKATSVQNWSFATHDPGPAIFFAQVALGEPIGPAKDAMLATLFAVKDRPITQEELDRVRTRFLKDFDQTVNDPKAFSALVEIAKANQPKAV